jgi:hypothetical protein
MKVVLPHEKRNQHLGRLFTRLKLVTLDICVWCLAVQMLRPKLYTIGEGELVS